jgi:hypothetical protein
VGTDAFGPSRECNEGATIRFRLCLLETLGTLMNCPGGNARSLDCAELADKRQFCFARE